MAVCSNNEGGKGSEKRLHGFGEKVKRFASLSWENVCKVGREDPKRVIHALKVGVSLTLVSMLYLLEPLSKGIGEGATWAVMTVVVVFEFTAGATLCKGLNRGFGTLLAGLLALCIKYAANASGEVFRAALTGAAVFIIGAAATYLRFFPNIKKNYDYGVVIFLLTFNLVAGSSYRLDSAWMIAHKRFYTIAIGCALCLLMSWLIFPNWSGEALHNSTASRLEGLAKSIEVCVNDYIYGETEASSDESEDPIYKGYKTILDSKSNDETLALHASWEPKHSRYCHRSPWKQYVKVGAVLRQFGYAVVALHGCLKTEIKTPRCVRALFKDPCVGLATEVSKVLLELAKSIRSRQHCCPETLSDNLQRALEDLNNAIKSQPRLFLASNDNQAHNMLAIAAAHAAGQTHLGSKVCTDHTNEAAERKVLRPQLSKIAITSLEFSEALPFAAFVSLLVEIVVKLEFVIEEVERLGTMASFKEYKPDDKITVKCETPRVDESTNNLTSHGGE
ncbi:hypothetical protein RJT34_30909 [Clitoria ternatea]|uniref:Aluminum-activated malate transporter n=1 Tax=Clitoria ternatea TaxID=43366 RepID=A0AAN9I7V2_CLITE